MQIKLPVDSYKGVDGSSLSETRCDQLVAVYDLLEDMGTRKITYLDLQEEVDRKKLFGSTDGKSAIRTFFPLLKKIDFVHYDRKGAFEANTFFTDLGKVFVLACRSLGNITPYTPHREEITNYFENRKKNAQREGLIRMYKNPDYKDHNIWIALRLFKELEIIHWNDFLYALHCIDEGDSIEKAISDIKTDSAKIRRIEFLKDNGTKLPTTCYTYIRSYLEEAGLIIKLSPTLSKVHGDAKTFFSQIQL